MLRFVTQLHATGPIQPSNSFTLTWCYYEANVTRYVCVAITSGAWKTVVLNRQIPSVQKCLNRLYDVNPCRNASTKTNRVYADCNPRQNNNCTPKNSVKISSDHVRSSSINRAPVTAYNVTQQTCIPAKLFTTCSQYRADHEPTMAHVAIKHWRQDHNASVQYSTINKTRGVYPPWDLGPSFPHSFPLSFVSFAFLLPFPCPFTSTFYAPAAVNFWDILGLKKHFKASYREAELCTNMFEKYDVFWRLLLFCVGDLQGGPKKNGATLHFPKYLENYWR